MDANGNKLNYDFRGSDNGIRGKLKEVAAIYNEFKSGDMVVYRDQGLTYMAKMVNNEFKRLGLFDKDLVMELLSDTEVKRKKRKDLPF